MLLGMALVAKKSLLAYPIFSAELPALSTIFYLSLDSFCAFPL
jgi:hypothetical protein